MHLVYDPAGIGNLVGEYNADGSLIDLVYMRNRFYSPSIGRFISEDPIGLAGGDLLFYRYVGNDPVNLVDPSGLFWGQVGYVGTIASMVGGGLLLTGAAPAWGMALMIAGGMTLISL